MFSRVAIVAIVAAAACGGAGTAAADSDTGATLCNYTMSDPHVVDVSGTTMVSATLEPSGCNGNAKPYSTQVCLSTPGSAGRCAELPGYVTAHAYLSPYVPGQTYTVRGRGCAFALVPSQTLCNSLGPVSVTL
ncbi:MAG: hypothetical protein HYZ38_23850 [Mycobacterium sp.]|nr:hypothetical protein [Mycobacterium sp.]